jgi:Yip1-like protein
MTDLLDIRVLLRMARQSVTDPKGGARVILALRLPVPVLWQFFLLQLVLSAILKVIVFAFFPTPEIEMGPTAAISFTMVEAAIGVILALATYHIGRVFGGAGTFAGALALIVWLQFILLCVNVVQLFVMMILPPAGDVITLLALALFFWLLAQFIAALHGFTSMGRVFLGIVLSLMALAFIFNIVLAFMGLRIG